MEKVIRLCGQNSCCPEVRITDEFVEIGADKNICKLSRDEWQILKEKIISQEI